MQNFLVAMERVELGSPMNRSTARKVVDRELQAVVKVCTTQTLILKVNRFVNIFPTGQHVATVPAHKSYRRQRHLPLAGQSQSHHR